MQIGENSIRCFHPDDTEAVVDLWQRCDLLRPWNDPYKDINRKLDDSADLFYVMSAVPSGDQHNDETSPTPVIVGAAMVGYEGHRGWVNYLAVDPALQRAGLGRKLMAHIEAELLSRGCPKINLQVRETNTGVIEFYRTLGYQVDAAVSLGKRLIPDAE